MPLSDSSAPSDSELRTVRRRGPGEVRTNGHNLIRKEFLFKILVIGELGSGKTSFIKRYVHNLFSEHYRATIGVDFALKVFTWDDEDNTIVRLQLWDIAGQGKCIQWIQMKMDSSFCTIPKNCLCQCPVVIILSW